MIKIKNGILINKINYIKDHIYSDEVILDGWETRTGIYKSLGTYEFDSDEWENISIGDTWECGDDVTRWFKRQVTIPHEYEGERVILDIEVGGEGVVYIDGKLVSALTSYYASEVNPIVETRRRVLISECAKGNETFEVIVEAGLNYMEFADRRRRGLKSVEYKFRDAKLAQVDTMIESYYFDTIVTYEAIQVLSGKPQGRLPREIEQIFLSLSKDSFMHERVLQALDDSLAVVDFDFDRERLVKSVDEAQKILWNRLDAIEHIPESEVCFAGHAHIDTAWHWPVKETIRKCARTFSNTIALMNEYPEYTFVQSQPQLYEYTKKYYPELYKSIGKRVREGRWELIGNAWVECDTNIPSGESLVRQILYGRNFFRDEFGKWSNIFWVPDVFGYSWALPQIIKRSGMEYFYTAKLNNNDLNRFPHTLFQWQGIDGTRIVSYLQRVSYNAQINPRYMKQMWDNFDQKEVCNETLITFGYGDGGGGPNYEMLEYSKRLKNFPGLPSSRIDSAQSFFDNVSEYASALPVWNDEMYYEFHRGTYTSQARTKRNNRKSELLYRQAEMAATIAFNEFNAKYPIGELTEGWKLILLNQFHDIIPGSSINEVYRDCERDYSKVFAIGNKAETDALEAIVSNIDFKGHDENIVVFNYLSWPITGLVDIQIQATNRPIFIEDDCGDKIPFSVERLDNQNILLSFEARDVPPMGYMTYKIVEGALDNEATTIRVTENSMENDFFKISIDKNGNMNSIYDKVAGREILSQGGCGNVLQIFEDRPERESAWNIDIEYQKKSWIINNVKYIEVKEVSAIKGVLRIAKTFNKSTIVQDITIYASTPRIDFCTQVEWQETEKLLKAAFEVDILSPEATYEIAYGSIRRPTHWNTSWDQAKFEVPAHKWADLSEGGYGVSILNDCKYGYDIKDNVMRITLLRAPIYPDPVADKGHHKFVYSLYPHRGDWIDGDVVHAGYELNAPLKGIIANDRGGGLPLRLSSFEIDSPNVIIDALKVAENGDGIIMRVYESTGTRGNVRVRTSIDISKAIECNLVEEDEGIVQCQDGEISFYIRPYEIKTFRLK